MIITWICFSRLPKKKVNKIIANCLTVFFIAIPFLLSWLYSDAGAQWFEQTFHVELNDFTSSRYALAVMVREHFQGDFNGFGTIKNYFATHGSYWAMIKAIHCDFLELYWECTIVGVAVYVYTLMKWAKSDYRILFVILYLFIEIMVGFMMNAYVEWVICYFLIYLIQNERKMEENIIL
ncbi:MAG: hypothetical protein LUG91_07100 [Ruminococcus sp.]|nr:hypothetical protein [Ruminococcus sp.]